MAAKKRTVADIKAAAERVAKKRADEVMRTAKKRADDAIKKMRVQAKAIHKTARKGGKKYRKGGKSYKVVSLRAALRAVRQAESRIKARGRYRRRKNPLLECGNPLRHFPKLEGRGRPPHARKWWMVSRYADGRVVESRFTDTVRMAHQRARLKYMDEHKTGGLVEILLDDGR